jgi:hypothetical protein
MVAFAFASLASRITTFEWKLWNDNSPVEFVIGYGLKDPYGFIYLPPGAPPPAEGEHVYGPWYKFTK